MKAPAISVLMPVRNAATTLAAAVASIRAQTCTDWELIIVDDGSSDGTLECLRILQRSDSRVRVEVGPARGIANALNSGLELARGEWVARMDADDESMPERLEEQRGFFLEHPEVGLVGSLVEFVGDRIASAGYGLYVDWINSLVNSEAIALNRFIESPFAHPSVMFRRELVSQLGGYCVGDFPEDYELWLRWMDAGVRMAKVPRTLLRWHDGPARLSRTDVRYSPEAFFRVKAGWIARDLARVEAGAGARPVWVWGAGRPTRKRAAELESFGVPIAGYIDVDAKKATPALGGTGRPVIGPASLPPAGEVFVLGYVSSRGARDLIRAELRARSYVEGRDFLMCA